MRCLDDHRQAKFGHGLLGQRLLRLRITQCACRTLQVARRRQILMQPDALGHDLVHAHAGGHHAGTGVGNAEQLKRALHRAVFAVAAMQRHKAAVKAFVPELGQLAFGRIKGMRIHALAAQCLQHAVAGTQRNLALGRTAAHQHGHLAQRFHIGRNHEAHACSFSLDSATTLAGTAPMEPAPMHSTTSPSRAVRRMVSGMS